MHVQVSRRELDNVRHAKVAVNKLLTRVKVVKKVWMPVRKFQAVQASTYLPKLICLSECWKMQDDA